MKQEESSPFKLLVLGRDREGPYPRLAEREGLAEHVVFAGSTDRPERYYGAADLLVHPTFYDACSLTVLEALASGLLVVTTSQNGAGGVLQQGEEGWVTDVKGRNTTIQTFPDGNLVVIPNSVLASSIVKNFTMPRKALWVSVQVGVSYASDLP